MTVFYLAVRILFRLEVFGLNNFYSWKGKNHKPSLIIARHRSWWDPIIIAGAISFSQDIRPIYVAKEELKWLDFIPWVNNHIIFVNRKITSIASFRKIAAGIKSNRDIVIFPEGTTIPKRKKAHRGIIAILKQFEDLPLFLFNIKTQGPYGNPEGRWYSYLMKKVRIDLRISQPFFLNDLRKRTDGLSGKESELAMVEALLKKMERI
jgi:1-acyl-sn-glycerol-3-phosphate acyltransferase